MGRMGGGYSNKVYMQNSQGVEKKKTAKGKGPLPRRFGKKKGGKVSPGYRKGIWRVRVRVGQYTTFNPASRPTKRRNSVLSSSKKKSL